MGITKTESRYKAYHFDSFSLALLHLLAYLLPFEGIYSWKHSLRQRKKWVHLYGKF
jgi:hypothetical protein